VRLEQENQWNAYTPVCYNVLYIIYGSRCDLLGEVGGSGRMGQVGSSRDHILIKAYYSYVSLVTCIKNVSLAVAGVFRGPPVDVLRVAEHLAPFWSCLSVPFGPQGAVLPLPRLESRHCGNDVIGIRTLGESGTHLSHDATMKVSLSRLDLIGMTWSGLE